MKSGYHRDHQEIFFVYVEAIKVGIQDMELEIVLGRRGHLSHWEREEEGKSELIYK